MTSVVSSGYWGAHWSHTAFDIAGKTYPLRKWVEKSFPLTENASCLEIGCYPGKLLAVFGEKGYTLSGVDSFIGTATELPAWLQSRNYKIGKFFESDFSLFNSEDKHDLVCSFGFIEHFTDWKDMVRKHVALTKSGGTVVIEVPNLHSPIYRFLYKTFEPSLLGNHVPGAMNLSNICEELKRNGCQIKSAEYVGHFHFRFITKHSAIAKLVSGLVNCLRPIFSLLPKSLGSRYIAVIATC